MKKKYLIISAVVVVLLGYGLLANSSKDDSQEIGQATEQVAKNTENQQKVGGGVLLI